MEIKKFWDNAVSYQEYIKNAEDRLENPKNQEDKNFGDYYKLGLQRMNRMFKSYVSDPKQKEVFEAKNFSGKILIISEPWCGDASQVIPVIVKFFDMLEVKITYRDQEPSLIDDFMINGTKSIPIIIMLTDDNKVISSWGPRPKHGKALLAKYKADPENYTKDQFYNDLQVYYSKNKGFDTIQELLEII